MGKQIPTWGIIVMFLASLSGVYFLGTELLRRRNG
jgi:hypothetical protein